MSDLTFVQGDTAPPIKATLKQKQDDGTLGIFELDDVDEVRFQMRKPDDKRYTVNAIAEILSPASDGKVRYVWAANDLNVPGEYVAQWELTFLDGRIQTTQPMGTVTIRKQ